MTIWVSTNGRPSNGAKALASQPGFKRAITGKGVKLNDYVINWGSTASFLPERVHRRVNLANSVAVATNKLSAFVQMESHDGVTTVEFTSGQDIAQSWSNDGFTVVVRNKLTGHSGDGIIIVEKTQPVPPAPLYTKYVFKEKEFRVHVVCDRVIDTQRKIRDPDRVPLDWKVRSHENGFIYVRNNIEPSNDRDQLAINAIQACGLDFGAVDIIQDKAGKYYVLEINTAPGLEGQTVLNYAEAFRVFCN